MNLSVRLVKERIGPVYFFKSGADLLEGDLDFAIGIAGKDIVCFVIDDAANFNNNFKM